MHKTGTVIDNTERITEYYQTINATRPKTKRHKIDTMRYLTILFFAVLFTTNSHAQPDITTVGQKDSCYLKYDKDHRVIRTNRYAEWQCGKLAGVIDCNGRLNFNQETNIVTLNNEDRVNAAGAGKPYTGMCETCHMNGTLERRVNFVNGKEEGVDTTFYESGCPQVIRSHVQGAEHGQWIFFYDSTQYMAWEMNYVAGLKHGKHIFFKKNGDTTRWENYNNGRLDGKKRTYYPNSKIKREVEYSNGVMDGKFKIFNMEGVVIEELNYKQGKKHEECKYFYNDGKPLKSENWDMGVKNGEFKIFFYQGTIQVSENFKKGLKEGWFMEYYPDGVTKRKALYKKDELLEEHRYDEQGKETYSFGAPSGDDMEDDEMPTTGKKKKKR